MYRTMQITIRLVITHAIHVVNYTLRHIRTGLYYYETKTDDKTR